MNANKRPKAPASTADVLHLDDFRGTESSPTKDASSPYAQRIQLVKSHVIRRLESYPAPAVAVAAAFIDAEGRIGITAAGIEPEMAASLSQELRALAEAIDRHSSKLPERQRTQRGSAGIALLVALSFAAATYLNDVAWLDATISLASQLAAPLLARRRSN